MKNATLVLSPALCWLASCASPPMAVSDAAQAERAIAQAMRSGAAEWAPRELALAQEKMALTRRWLASGDPVPARWLAEQAQVDAELAAVRAARAAPRKVAARF